MKRLGPLFGNEGRAQLFSAPGERRGGIIVAMTLALVLISCAAAVVMSMLVSRASPPVDEVAARRARAYPRHPSRSFPDGTPGRLVGVAVRSEPLLESPLTGRACIAYVFKVYEYRDQEVGWHLVGELAEGGTFTLRDETGPAVVFAQGSQWALTIDRHGQSDALSRAPWKVERLLQTHGLTSIGATLKYEEGILSEGEMVSVCGVGRYEAASDAELGEPTGYRTPPRHLVMAHSGERKLFISNDPSTFG